jgi:hypothetical protein
MPSVTLGLICHAPGVHRPWIRPDLPMTFAIAMGVRKDDDALYRDIEAALQTQRRRIEAILDRFGDPRIDAVAEAVH